MWTSTVSSNFAYLIFWEKGDRLFEQVLFGLYLLPGGLIMFA